MPRGFELEDRNGFMNGMLFVRMIETLNTLQPIPATYLLLDGQGWACVGAKKTQTLLKVQQDKSQEAISLWLPIARASILLLSYLIVTFILVSSINLCQLIPIQKIIGFSDLKPEALISHNYNVGSSMMNWATKCTLLMDWQARAQRMLLNGWPIKREAERIDRPGGDSTCSDDLLWWPWRIHKKDVVTD